MPTIRLETHIHAPIDICFDLSRSIALHELSTAETKEVAVGGCTSGLIGRGEFVTWEATHFGVRQRLTSYISEMVRPFHFRDEQLKGAFKSMVHDHHFVWRDGVVIMTDIFRFRSPLGPLGWIFDRLVLKAYLRRFLLKRNHMIKTAAESGSWRSILKDTEQN